MRDPNRISEMLNLIGQVWMLSPDLRLCQLLSVAAAYGEQHSSSDLFYIEDDTMIKKLRLWIVENEK